MFKPDLWQIPQVLISKEQTAQVKSAVLTDLNRRVEILRKRLEHIAENHSTVKFASSLAVEDMLISDVIVKSAVPIEIFTLDTGRLNPETLALIDQIEKHYPSLKLQRYSPKTQDVARYIEQFGQDAFYQSVELRKQCCFIRKVEPLNRALQQADAWLTGQRREQSVTRSELPFCEHDPMRKIAKYNPIFDWSEQDVWAYILTFDVPFNPLYRQGYPSIGCEPCTRPVKAEEDIRAGRWWWENRDSKECGLHK